MLCYNMIKNIILLAIIFVLVDAGFIFLIRNTYQNMIQKIQGSSLKMKLVPTIACYVILISSLLSAPARLHLYLNFLNSTSCI